MQARTESTNGIDGPRKEIRQMRSQPSLVVHSAKLGPYNQIDGGFDRSNRILASRANQRSVGRAE